ncbi:site-specific tyrosine recombinase XerC [compost metagenome]
MYYHPKPAASHAAALRPGQLRHVIRVASITGRQPIRDVMLLWLTHSTGVRVTELASIEIRDLLHPSGQMREEVYLRAAITKHSRPRTIYLTHPKTITAIEAWFAYRRERGWGMSSDPEYRGFRPDERLVLTHKGRAFELARKVRQLQGGPVEYRCCDALQQLVSRLYRQAGIKGGSSHSGRRTLAAKVLANTGRVELVQLLLGHAEADHVWPYLDVRPEVIRQAFEVGL